MSLPTWERGVKEISDESFVAVVYGGREANKTLLNGKFDYIFFTGSIAVGKTVMESAARHLILVTLELDGKVPVLSMTLPIVNWQPKNRLGKISECGTDLCCPGLFACS